MVIGASMAASDWGDDPRDHAWTFCNKPAARSQSGQMAYFAAVIPS
jgi:hypothetical protein